MKVWIRDVLTCSCLQLRGCPSLCVTRPTRLKLESTVQCGTPFFTELWPIHSEEPLQGLGGAPGSHLKLVCDGRAVIGWLFGGLSRSASVSLAHSPHVYMLTAHRPCSHRGLSPLTQSLGFVQTLHDRVTFQGSASCRHLLRAGMTGVCPILPMELQAHTCWVPISLPVLSIYYQCKTNDYF